MRERERERERERGPDEHVGSYMYIDWKPYTLTILDVGSCR